MSKNSWRIALVGLITCAAGMMTASVSQAAEPASPGFCHVLISAGSASHPSNVLARVCSTESSAKAKAEFDKLTVRDGNRTVSTLTSTPIMVWWQSTTGSSGFGAGTVIYGDSGNCGSTGYHATVSDTWWQENLSAIVGMNGCNTIQVQDISRNNQSGVWWSPAYSLGYFNDNVGYIHTWYRFG